MLFSPHTSLSHPQTTNINEKRNAQAPSYANRLDVFYNELVRPTYKRVKAEDNHSFMPAFEPIPNPFQFNTVDLPTPNSQGSDYFQDFNQSPVSSNIFSLSPNEFLDPDMFFNNSTEILQSPDPEPCSIAETMSTNESPFRNPICLSDFNSDLYLDGDMRVKVDFQDTEVVEKREEVRLEETGTTSNLEQYLQKIECKNKYLVNLVDSVLKGNIAKPHELSPLNTIEKCIVEAVYEKKRHNPNKNRDKGKKREEEKQKFFFKGLLKYTETQFFSDLTKSKKTRRRKLDKYSYYQYYWEEISKEHKIEMTNFFHPGKKVAVSSSGKTNAQTDLAENRRLKSINSTYIDLILTSDKFREEANYYLENVFMQELVGSRCKKIAKMLEKLREVAKQAITQASHLPLEKRTQSVVVKLQDYIILNTKSKLPWSDAELLETKEFAQVALERQSLLSNGDSA
jgi:hypothetical protein